MNLPPPPVPCQDEASILVAQTWNRIKYTDTENATEEFIVSGKRRFKELREELARDLSTYPENEKSLNFLQKLNNLLHARMPLSSLKTESVLEKALESTNPQN